MTAANATRGESKDRARTTRSGGGRHVSKTGKESNSIGSKGKGSREANRGYYIVKPVGGCQGKDIFLISGIAGWKRVSKAHQVCVGGCSSTCSSLKK